MGQVREHTCRVNRCLEYSACGWHKLFRLVRSWVHIPIFNTETEFCVVEQVQLCD